MRSLLSILCLFGLLYASQADQCIGTPNTLPSGSNCGGGVSCAFGYQCDTTFTCNSFLGNNAPCNNNFQQCGYGGQCICQDSGTTGCSNYACLSNVNPGSPCSQPGSATASLGLCGPNEDYCNTQGVCEGGQVGDTCIQDTDCNPPAPYITMNLTCVSSVCTGVPNGGLCYTGSQCLPGSNCINSQCTATVTSGSCYGNLAGICGYGSFCIYNPIANTSMCTAFQSVSAGGYCGGPNNGYVCEGSLRCFNGYCAPGRVTQCSQGIPCSADEICTCGGLYMYAALPGLGACQKNPCLNAESDFYTCVSQKCQLSSLSIAYTGSCLLQNCASEYTTFAQCASGSTLTVFTLLVAILAFIATKGL